MTLLALLLTPHETNKLNFEVNVILLSSRYAGSAAKILKSKFKLYFLASLYCNDPSLTNPEALYFAVPWIGLSEL